MNPVDLLLLCFYATSYHSPEQKSQKYIYINKNRPVDLLFYKQFLAEQRLESRATQSLIFHSQHRWTEKFVESEQAWQKIQSYRGKIVTHCTPNVGKLCLYLLNSTITYHQLVEVYDYSTSLCWFGILLCKQLLRMQI